MTKQLLALSIGVLLMAGSGCNKRVGDELEFFDVSLQKLEITDVGDVTLRGTVSGFIQAQADAYGFVYSSNSADLADPDLNTIGKISFTPTTGASGNVDFESIFHLPPGATVLFRAYAVKGGRLVFSKETESATLGNIIAFYGSPVVDNDAIIAQMLISGLFELQKNFDSIGFVYSLTDSSPEINDPNCYHTIIGPVNDNGIFTDTITNLAFNSTYYVRAYGVSVSGRRFYSKTVQTVAVKGGWKSSPNFPMPYYNGLVASAGNTILGGFGININQPTSYNQYPKDTWLFETQTMQWVPNSVYPGTIPRVNAVSFTIGNTIYICTGEYYDPYFTLSSRLLKYHTDTQTWSPSESIPANTFRARTGAVAFSMGNYGYVGSGYFEGDVNGTIVKTEVNDFWQYDPSTSQWRQIASLPLKLTETGAVQNAGRQEAVTFNLNDGIYVGGGQNGGVYLRDFWKFTPPTSPVDTGKWELHPDFFDGQGRSQAAFFSIGNKGYFGTGLRDEQYLYDFWEFDPASGWAPIQNFRGGPIRAAMGFASGSNGYVCTGIRKVLQPDLNLKDVPLDECWIYVPNQ